MLNFTALRYTIPHYPLHYTTLPTTLYHTTTHYTTPHHTALPTSPLQLVPINIDHSADRAGALVIVVLGESVVSNGMEYNSLNHAHTHARYYTAMVRTYGVWCDVIQCSVVW
jgi:low temperature requirement protein LtrA